MDLAAFSCYVLLKKGCWVLLAKFKTLVVKLLDYYPVAATILFLVVLSVAGLADGEGSIDISMLVFGIPAPVVAFAVSRAVKAEFKKATERKRPEHGWARFEKYCWGTIGLAFIIFAILAWFEEPTVLDRAFSSLMCAVYGPAMAFVGYKGSRYLLRTLWGVDDK